MEFRLYNSDLITEYFPKQLNMATFYDTLESIYVNGHIHNFTSILSYNNVFRIVWYYLLIFFNKNQGCKASLKAILRNQSRVDTQSKAPSFLFTSISPVLYPTFFYVFYVYKLHNRYIINPRYPRVLKSH